MANLCAGICSSLMKVRKAQDTDGFTQRRTGLQASGRGGSLPVESVAAFPWNGWQACHGISGSLRMESVAALAWNQRQRSCGIAGSFAVESVAGLAWDTQTGCQGALFPLLYPFLNFSICLR